jgi:hypothetical protein
MTIDEYRRALAEMSDLKFKLFQERFGGNPVSREERVQEFAYKQDHERVICYILQTMDVHVIAEHEKHVHAVVRASEAAEISAKSARISAWAATISALIALVAVALSRVIR